MALETVVFQQDPFNYSHNIYNLENFHDYDFGYEGYNNWDSFNSSIAQSYNNNSNSNNNNSSSEVCTGFSPAECFPAESTVVSGRRKRRRTKCAKNKEEIENQRMTHIAVERNRRRQMNDYLAVLRSLMPPSYAQRGDQASIVGGAINFVKELEQLLQFLEAHKQVTKKNQPPNFSHNNNPFSKFFTFPQYSTGNNHPLAAAASDEGSRMTEERRSAVADIEVTMVESHANVKVLSRRRPKQLLKIVNWLQAMCLTILHLSVTTADDTVLYSFSVKVEENCQLNTVTEIATAVHEMVAMIKEEAMSC